MNKGAPSRRISHSSLVATHWLLLLALMVFYCATAAAADELSLKDGRKISGTIVGFENGMFRLETEFGFILVRRDKVVSIKVSEGATKESPQNAEAHGSASRASGNAKGNGDVRLDGEESASDRRASPAATAGNSSPPPSSAPKAPPISRLLNEPPPAHMAEHEEGNNYFNDTFHFVMYKPPDWKIYNELPRGKVSALVALASEDEQTLLFVDRQVWSGTPDLKNDIVESNLRTIYQDYKKLSESETQIDGHSAVRRDFSGLIDGVEWHGVAVRVVQGSSVYGIVGMTSAETFQFQEAVFNKIVKSFHFLPATSQATAAPRTP